MNRALSNREWRELTNGFVRIVEEERGERHKGTAYMARAVQVELPNNASEDGWPEIWADVIDPHGTAALLLYGQSFGFTWADVDNVIDVAPDLAARISALLPPREKE